MVANEELQPVVLRLPQRLAGIVRRLAAQESNSSISSIISHCINLRHSIYHHGCRDTPSVLDEIPCRQGSTLVKGYLTSSTRNQIRFLVDSTGTSVGRVLGEGVALFLASRGLPAPKRGLAHLTHGRKASCWSSERGEMPIVILDDDDELNHRNATSAA